MTEDSTQCPTDKDRRESARLSDDDVKRIAKATRDEFLNGIYQEIGRGIMKRLFWGLIIIGLSALALWDKVQGWAVQHIK